MYVRMAIYRDNGRGIPTDTNQFYLWLDILGIDNVIKVLPIQDEN